MRLARITTMGKLIAYDRAQWPPEAAANVVAVCEGRGPRAHPHAEGGEVWSTAWGSVPGEALYGGLVHAARAPLFMQRTLKHAEIFSKELGMDNPKAFLDG